MTKEFTVKKDTKVITLYTLMLRVIFDGQLQRNKKRGGI